MVRIIFYHTDSPLHIHDDVVIVIRRHPALEQKAVVTQLVELGADGVGLHRVAAAGVAAAGGDNDGTFGRAGIIQQVRDQEWLEIGVVVDRLTLIVHQRELQILRQGGDRHIVAPQVDHFAVDAVAVRLELMVSQGGNGITGFQDLLFVGVGQGFGMKAHHDGACALGRNPQASWVYRVG